MYKGIVFDLDGTLADSPLCFPSIRTELGVPEGHFILEYLEELSPDVRAEKHMRLEEIEVEAAQRATLFPGVRELLIDLRERGVPVGIFTRNCRAAADHVIAAHEMQIDLVVTREDAPAKPDLRGLHLFLTEWRLQAHELLFVGDFHFDIECGQRAGVKTALFTNGGKEVSQHNGERELLPDHVIPHFALFWESLRPR